MSIEDSNESIDWWWECKEPEGKKRLKAKKR